MPFFVKDRSHRDREERHEQLRQFEPASPTLRAIWALDDSLRAIDAAERIRARGWMTAIEHYQVSAALDGRSPEEARAAARARFERDYGEAVASDRMAA
jgi:hypothetical protein